MKLARWSPFAGLWSPLDQFQSEVNRLIDHWAGDSRMPMFGGFPALNVWEDDEHCVVEAELPGIELKDLEITVLGNQLTVQGERRAPVQEKGVLHRQERLFGNFARTLKLPYAVDPDTVEARMENGILTIKLSKHESARPRRIAVKAE